MKKLRKIVFIMYLCLITCKRNYIFILKASISPIFLSLTALFMLRDSNVEQYFSYVIVGSSIMGMWISNVLITSNEIRSEIFLGTFELINYSTTKISTIVWIRAIVYSLLGLISTSIMILLFLVINNNEFSIQNLGLFSIFLLFSVLCLSTMGLLLSALFVLMKEFSSLAVIFTRLIFVLCGVMFPITLLPKGIEVISYLLAPTWIVILLQSIITNNYSVINLTLYTFIILLQTICYYYISNILFHKISYKLTKGDSLGGI
ncbi:hypothetical protein COL01_11475 [Bacillus thuringiensis]|uniref:ABC transmembrane type-2 domain-containing protein n=2 Tax=Bacillus thuringiensis TaxID=1428 RepID=A0A9X6WSR4_BACTU|nr:hypothetical protein COJ15_05940 [Bacillus thuringiensis]PFN60567.1 hypothetical protein COJ75_11105 [Bacillus thuringiensis]PFV34469.1 hypothetical protein COL01_11475 [Bacillus thuringiensis]